jgi:hypothetical protein
MSNDDTLIAQLQARNAALTTERDACRDESRRLATELADSQVECDRLRAALYDARLLLDEAHAQRMTGEEYNAAVGRIDAALAGTPAPRPPRDEPAKLLRELGCCIGMDDYVHESDEEYWNVGNVAKHVTWLEARALSDERRRWQAACAPLFAEQGPIPEDLQADDMRGLRLDAPTPAPPDHGAFRALAESWGDAAGLPWGDAASVEEARGIRYALQRAARELLALCSPVVGEPSRAEVFNPECQCRDDHTSWCPLYSVGGTRKTSDVAPAAVQSGAPRDTAGNQSGIASSSGAAEDQPQPACPPEAMKPLCLELVDRRPGTHCTLRRGHTGRHDNPPAAERPRQGEPHYSEAAWFREVENPAPEAQRAQSEPCVPKRYKVDRWQDYQTHEPGQWNAKWLDNLDHDFDTRAEAVAACIAHAAQRTPASDIAAAVAELETATHAADMRTMGEHSRRALACLQGTTEPPGGDKESER